MRTTRPYAVVLAAAALVVGGWLLAFDGLGGVRQLPDVGYTLLDGTHASTGDLRGKVVLINFWATDCVTCEHEMPQLAATYEKFRARGYETLAVATSHDRPEVVRSYAASRRLPFRVAHDRDGSVARTFGQLQMTPTSLLVNRHGEIVKRYYGEPDFVALAKLVDELLAEG